MIHALAGGLKWPLFMIWRGLRVDSTFAQGP